MQGRTLDRRPQEVRNHIPYLVYFSIISRSKYGHWERLENRGETWTVESIKIFGLILEENGWRITKSIMSTAGRDIYRSAMTGAASAVYRSNCVTMRIWRGLPSTPPLAGFSDSEMFLWYPSGNSSDEKASPYFYSAEPGDIDKPIMSRRYAWY